MIAKYMEEAAPSIQPAVVESRVSGLIGGVKVSGYVDLLDTEGRLIDSKSSTKPIKGIAHDHRLQLTSYAMITPAASGACRFHWVPIFLEPDRFQLPPQGVPEKLLAFREWEIPGGFSLLPKVVRDRLVKRRTQSGRSRARVFEVEEIPKHPLRRAI
jgi:hypothetical protein